MYAYIARQPILNRRREVAAYELLYRDGSGNAARITDGDAATRGVLTDALTLFGLPHLTDGLPAYVNFTRNLLLNDFARQVKPEEIVVQVMGHIPVDEALSDKLRELRRAGYTLALKTYTEQSKFRQILSLFNVIRVDFMHSTSVFQKDVVKTFSAPGVQLLADKVETTQEFTEARNMGYSLFQGYFFEKPFCLFKQLPPLVETSYGKLLLELLRPAANMNTCAAIVGEDLMLSYMFRRHVQALNLSRGRPGEDLRVFMYRVGTNQLRRWACLVLMKQNNVTGNDDLLKRAYQRGLFMEQLAENSDMDVDTESGQPFLLGVFSLIDKVTGSSLEHLLRGMNLPQPMGDALLGRGENACTRLLQYAVIYEMGNERLILPDIQTRLNGTEIVNLYMTCRAETDAALAKMESTNS